MSLIPQSTVCDVVLIVCGYAHDSSCVQSPLHVFSLELECHDVLASKPAGVARFNSLRTVSSVTALLVSYLGPILALSSSLWNAVLPSEHSFLLCHFVSSAAACLFCVWEVQFTHPVVWLC